MKKKISKAIAVLLSAVILFAQAIPAFAALTEGNKYSYTERYLDAYYSTGTWQTADGHTHNNRGQVCLRNLPNGEPLYCIQIYEGCDGSVATAENIKNTSLWKNELTPTAQRGITQSSIYGYPNYTYGYSNDEAQLATNILLWEFEIGRRTDFSVASTTFAREICENYPDALECYYEILKACNNHQIRPSFSNSKVTLKGTGSNNAVTITDTNGVLNNFKVTSTNDRIKVNKSGNNLTVYATGSGKLSGRLIFTKDKTDINSAFALTGANQTLFYGSIADPVTAPLTVELSLGNLQIVKTSEDGKISDVEFNISGNGINSNVKTDSAGKIDLTELNEGTYTVTEKRENKYMPQSAQTVTVTVGQTATVNFNNTLVKGTISIFKSGEILSTVTKDESGTYQPVYETTYLPNAEYEVYAAEDITNGSIHIEEGTLVDTVVTDSEGKATTKGLYLKEDGTAEYKLIETKAPEGYVLDTEEHIVTLTQNGADVDVSSVYEAFDERQKVSVEFTKAIEVNETFGIGSNDEIKNIAFGLFAEKDITAADGTSIPADALIETIRYSDLIENSETAENYIYAKYTAETDLPFGDYYIHEIAADEHYITSDIKYPFTFSYTNQDEDVVHIQINDGKDIINKLKYGEIHGLKVDNNNKPLEGALIGLFKEGTTEFTKDTVVMTATSAKDGSFSFTAVPYGKYIVKEISAPEGYILDDESYEVNITENEQIVEIKIENRKIPTSPDSPKTGAEGMSDTTNLLLAGSILTSICIALTVTILVSKRIKKNGNKV